MSKALIDLYNDLDQASLKAKKPNQSIFLCGGFAPENSKEIRSFRQYLLYHSRFQNRIKAKIVLAESAIQLYRDSGYSDLITFEEDIARISTLVLVIVESAGSFAELGAFVTSSVIHPSLAVLVQSQFQDAESFIRFGPVERLIKADHKRVAFVPWKTSKQNLILKSSISGHFNNLISFVNKRLESTTASVGLSTSPEVKEFYTIYWIIFLATAITLDALEEYAKNFFPNITKKELNQKLYSMKIAGWVDKHTYFEETYYFALAEQDPFHYSFQNQVPQRDRDTARRKTDIAGELKRALKLPGQVRRHVIEQRN